MILTHRPVYATLKGSNSDPIPMAGRPRKPYIRAEFKVSLPAALVAEVDILLNDPLTNRPKYGARARLVESLLRAYLARLKGQEEEKPPTVEQLLHEGVM